MAEEPAKQDAYQCLNQLFVDLFHEILEIEECSVRRAANNSLTMTEIHTLMAIKPGEQNMSQIAKELGVTISTLTTAINKLEAKGFVRRKRDESDRRVVHICLTARGRSMAGAHERFHRNMTKAALEGLDPEETKILTATLQRLTDFFYHEKEKFIHPE